MHLHVDGNNLDAKLVLVALDRLQDLHALVGQFGDMVIEIGTCAR